MSTALNGAEAFFNCSIQTPRANELKDDHKHKKCTPISYSLTKTEARLNFKVEQVARKATHIYVLRQS